MSQNIRKDNILKKTQELADLISKQEETRLYREAEEKIKNHPKIQGIITEIKLKQQELVHAKHYKKVKHIEKLEAELDQLNEELYQIPLVRQYQDTQAELNQILQSVVTIIKDQVSDILPLEKD